MLFRGLSSRGESWDWLVRMLYQNQICNNSCEISFLKSYGSCWPDHMSGLVGISFSKIEPPGWKNSLKQLDRSKSVMQSRLIITYINISNIPWYMMKKGHEETPRTQILRNRKFEENPFLKKPIWNSFSVAVDLG